MKDVREILSQLNSGSINLSDIPEDLVLQLCSYMLFEDMEAPMDCLQN